MGRAEELTEQILKKLKEKNKDVKVKREDILRRMKLLLEEFRVPEAEAIRTIINYLSREYEIPKEELVYREAPMVKVKELSKPGEWVSLKVKVVQLWESSSPNVSQAGLVGDDTEIIKFVKWSKSNLPDVEEGRSYIFRNVVVDSFQGKLQINLTSSSEIVEIDEDVPLVDRNVEIVGALVTIQQNSGLIRKCKECGRVVSKGVCPKHGKVEVEDALRLKVVFDDGFNTYEAILGEEIIKSLTGIGLEEAIQMAREHFDREIVLSTLKEKLLGRYFRIRGRKGERYIITESVEPYELGKEELEKLLAIVE